MPQIKPAQMMRGFSMEVTLPAASDLARLEEILPRSTKIFVSAPPGYSSERLSAAAIAVRSAGFEPIPHIAARNYQSAEELERFVHAICGNAGAQEVLVLGGDIDCARGPYNDANSIIATGFLEKHGLTTVHIAGYPEGHPKIAHDVLSRSIDAKLRNIECRGLQAAIVSQFCFEADRILTWLRQTRGESRGVPIRIGVPGPSTINGLARFAFKCGVKASVRSLASGRATRLLSQFSPDELISGIASASNQSELELATVHVYSFGGILHTARWASAFIADVASTSAGR